MFKQGGGEESSFFVSVGGEGVFCPGDCQETRNNPLQALLIGYKTGGEVFF